MRTKSQTLTCLLIASAAVTAGARHWLNPGAPEVTPTAQPGRVETEHLTLTPAGFEPAEITRPAGLFKLVVDNRAGAEEVEFALARERGDRVAALRERRRRLSWGRS